MPVLFIVLIFVAWLVYEQRKTTKESGRESVDFWKRENEASFVPKKSLDDVRYISLPENIIPITDETSSRELRSACRDLKALLGKEIADLSEFTNTDLKLKYGTGNFPALSAADANFTKLVQLFTKCCRELIAADRKSDALKIFDFCDCNDIHTSVLSKMRNSII